MARLGRIPEIGEEIPVWWDTGDGRPAGQHMARVIAVAPYTGPFPFVLCIAKLTAPNTRRGWVEMSIAE